MGQRRTQSIFPRCRYASSNQAGTGARVSRINFIDVRRNWRGTIPRRIVSGIEILLPSPPPFLSPWNWSRMKLLWRVGGRVYQGLGIGSRIIIDDDTLGRDGTSSRAAIHAYEWNGADNYTCHGSSTCLLSASIHRSYWSPFEFQIKGFFSSFSFRLSIESRRT